MGSSDGIRCMLLRGGTSKGAYFVADDVPADTDARDDLLLRIMGTPDARQIDGLGGAHPLTSKVAIVRRSSDLDVDVDYLFLQIGVDEPTVGTTQTCGNLLAGVGPFAVERGLVEAHGDHARGRGGSVMPGFSDGACTGGSVGGGSMFGSRSMSLRTRPPSTIFTGARGIASS